MSGQPSPWANSFRGFDDWDDGRKQQVVTQFLNAAGQLMQNPKVVPKPSDSEIHLRGTYMNYATRVRCDTFWDLELEMKAPNQQVDYLHVRFDPDSAPSPGDVDPWDEDEDVRVFLARCVFVEDSASDIETSLRLVKACPPEFLQHMFNLMQTNRLSSFTINNEGPRTGFRDNIGEMWDPMTQLSQILWLMGYAGNVFAGLPPQQQAWAQGGQGAAPQQQAAMLNVGRAKCSYCTTMYLLTAESKCPNCGAPYTG